MLKHAVSLYDGGRGQKQSLVLSTAFGNPAVQMQKLKQLQLVASWSIIICFVTNVPYFSGYNTDPPSSKLMPKPPMQMSKGKALLEIQYSLYV